MQVDESILFKTGIYAIINKNLQIVYVGMTQDSFLVRWMEHTARLTKYFDNPERSLLYLHKGTRYIVLKEIDKKISTKEFLKWESNAIKFYKKRGWTVVSKDTYQEDMKEYERKQNDERKRYKRLINHMVRVLGTVQTKGPNTAFLYSKLYKKVSKHFNVKLEEREGKNTIDKLTKAELEFMMIDLFPRYYEKKLEISRLDYKKSLQLTLL